jgi:hypothetical protein
MSKRSKFLVFIFSELLALPCMAQKPEGRSVHYLRLPKGYSVPQITRSPSGRFGVLVPDRDHYKWVEEQNKLIDLRTGRILAVIHAHSGAVQANHVEIEPGNWSRDGSLFLWRVGGKWCPTALVLLKIQNNKVLWQLNVLVAAQRAILTRTKRSSPTRYRAAVRENHGSGAAFPEGFTVNVTVNVDPGKPLSMPLNFTASFTSNPKQIESYPKSAELNSDLKGIITKDGKLNVMSFALNVAR